MKRILAIPDKVTFRDLLETLCEAEEFEDVRLRADEKTGYKEAGRSDRMRFAVKDIKSTKDKVLVIVQMVCGGHALADIKVDSQPVMQSLSVLCVAPGAVRPPSPSPSSIGDAEPCRNLPLLPAVTLLASRRRSSTSDCSRCGRSQLRSLRARCMLTKRAHDSQESGSIVKYGLELCVSSAAAAFSRRSDSRRFP